MPEMIYRFAFLVCLSSSLICSSKIEQRREAGKSFFSIACFDTPAISHNPKTNDHKHQTKVPA